MGARANIVSRSGNEQVVMYSHWDGQEIVEIARRGIEKAVDAGRGDDWQYFNRILFCELIKNDVDGSTGFGLSQEVHDGGDGLVEINLDSQTVSVNGSIHMPISDFISE